MANRVHPTAVIGPGVELGTNNVIGPYAVLLGPCTIGDDNWIGPSTCIGTPAEMRGGPHPAWDENPGGAGVRIGSRTVIREFTTVQAPTSGATVIGDDCYVMTKAHVPHDGVLEDHVTVACGVLIGGHSRIGRRANLGLNTVLHQGSVVGPGAMIGMASVVTRAVPPFATAYGSPARVKGVNRVGMQRAGVPDAQIEALARRYAEGQFDAPVEGWDTAWAWYREALAATG